MSAETISKIDVAGLKISSVKKAELLPAISTRIKSNQKTFVCTPYSEFLHATFTKPEFRDVLNSADFAIADGIGILWARYFLSIPMFFKRYYLSILESWVQVIWTGATILLNPKRLYQNGIPEKIVGADFAWDLARLAAENNFSLYLLGGMGDVPELTSKVLKNKFPNLNVVGASNKDMNDESIFEDLNLVKPDMLFVAFKAQTAEEWIVSNLENLPVKFVIALGGTFDYIAGKKKQPPRFVRNAGLEWLYRLITQPSRVHRIFNATWGLVLGLVRYKVFDNAGFRANGVAVVVNSEGKILLCKRVPSYSKSNPKIFFEDYWQFPQGGLDKNENHVFGAQRELREETGISSVEVLGEARFKNSYLWNNPTRKLFRFKTYHFKGQIQDTVFFKFVGEETEIKLDQRELLTYEWLSPQEVLKKIAPERVFHAEKVLAELEKIQL